MDKKYFFERYSLIFGTTTFKETKEKWDLLPKEKKDELRQSLRKKKLKEYYSNHKVIGKKQSEETKEKRRKSIQKFYKENPNHIKDKMNNLEIKQKISDGLTEFYSNEENRKQQSERLKTVYKNDLELHERISNSLKEYWEDFGQTPDGEEAIQRFKEYYKSEENRKLQSNKMKEIHNDISIRKRISNSLKNYWSKYRETPEGQKAIENFAKSPKGKGTSNIEKSIQDYVKSITSEEVILNDKKLLKGKELDIYIPSKKVAIEINGLVWHCSKFKPDYKIQLSKKTDLCNELGIRLIHFYDDEIREKLPIVKSIIASALGIYQQKIFARKCQLKEINKNEAHLFFEQNHISGTAKANTFYGLFYNDILVQAISLGKNRFSKDKNTELIRMATLLNTQVLGGFSKLMSVVPECESYVDLRLYNGKGYFSSGWKIIEKTKNGYYYTDFYKRYPRQMFMKSRLPDIFENVETNMKEEDICQLNGFYQIYNCGNLKLKWKNEKISK